jgi:thiosulfate reductase cytochrome b subunit
MQRIHEFIPQFPLPLLFLYSDRKDCGCIGTAQQPSRFVKLDCKGARRLFQFISRRVLQNCDNGDAGAGMDGLFPQSHYIGFMDGPTDMESGTEPGVQPGTMVHRHRLSTRLWHGANALLLYILFTSGLGIFNAHPRLYWGQAGANFDPAWLTLDRFPGWITLPGHYSLTLSRHWHLAAAPLFAFALLAYMLWSLINGHIARDLSLRRADLSPRHLWQDVKDHARLRFPAGTAALRYNVLQKGSYVAVIFVLLPLLILTGLTMSPGMNAAWPWLLDLFGGRQSARSIHFLAAFTLAAFFFVHMVMVLLAGPFNEIRAILTGRFRVPGRRP